MAAAQHSEKLERVHRDVQKIVKMIVHDRPCVTGAVRGYNQRYRPRFEDDRPWVGRDGCCEDSDEDAHEDEEEIGGRRKTVVCYLCLSTFSVPIQEP